MGLRERFEEHVERTAEHWWWTGATQESGHGSIWDGTYTEAGNPRVARAHKVAYELYVGPVPEGCEVEHTCHQPACVWPLHLRAVTHQQNMANRAGANRSSATGVRGVIREKRTGRFRPAVKVNGRTHYRGSYATLDEAADVAEAMRRELLPVPT